MSKLQNSRQESHGFSRVECQKNQYKGEGLCQDTELNHV